jgi:hypothetical protein
MLNQLQVHREIIYDLATDYLQPLPCHFARLAYLASLRNPNTGTYAHHKLELLYANSSVHQVLEKCHEEIFERLLELPLSQQLEDLRIYLKPIPGDPQENIHTCARRKSHWLPDGSAAYLQKLFSSNLHALCHLLLHDLPKARSAT